MRKKLFFSIILLIIMFSVTPVFAAEVLTVCDVACDFSSVEEVFEAIDAGRYNTDVVISVNTWDEQKISDHTLSYNVGIQFDNNAGVINGEGSTITIPKGVDIWFSGTSYDLKNLKINYTGGLGIYDDGFIDDVLYFDSGNVNLNNVTIARTSAGTPQCRQAPAAIYNDADNLNLDNVKVENFSYAVASPLGNVVIRNSTLNNNYSSFEGNGNVTVEDSSIKNIGTRKSVTTKNVGDLKVFFYDSNFLNTMQEDDYCEIAGKKGIHLPISNDVTISMDKTLDISLNNTTSIENVVGLFRDGNININDFTFTSSDNNIATVKNNIVTLLKSGRVSIVASNDDTKESYTLNLRISNPITSNPLTKPNTFFTIGIILIMLGGITIFRNIKSEQ